MTVTLRRCLGNQCEHVGYAVPSVGIVIQQALEQYSRLYRVPTALRRASREVEGVEARLMCNTGYADNSTTRLVQGRQV